MAEEEGEEGQQQHRLTPPDEPAEAAQQDYSWPMIRFDVPPQRAYHFHKQFGTDQKPNNFLKGVKWSPDGTCLLSSSEDNTLRVLALPEYGGDDSANASSSNHGSQGILWSFRISVYSFAANLVVTEGESVYDFCWYPLTYPLSCVFASTTRDHPIHVWDATTGQLCCTYRADDDVDEITAAFSIAFNPAGNKIFAGYNKSIRVFDVHRPGRDFESHSTLQGNKEGQTGIISAIAFSPTHTVMLATGSYCQTTAIYREDNMELLYVLRGQQGGVTHVLFSKDGNYLYTGGRKDPFIMCWDVRKAVDVVHKWSIRIYFDVEPLGRHLGTGGQDGLVHIYDLQTRQWVSGFYAASNTVNGFSFHPFLDENCVSIWGFAYDSTTNGIDSGDGGADLDGASN
ncbi:hypothetical protein ACJRO7_021660 [Eucalyptus globulus]|uniref:Telomerase Cajal body protein 1 n=1 Tax=Eucalyptus globulus TaxID=34317 RepID=A0ABD3KT58_EUCGL